MLRFFALFISKKNLLTGSILILVLLGFISSATAGKSEAKGYLGVGIERLSGDEREEFGAAFGVLVIRVSEDSAAEKAGIKKYDVIQYYDGEKMHRPIDLAEAVRADKPGAKVKIKLVRDDRKKEVTVTLDEYKNGEFRRGGNDDPHEFFKFQSSGYLGVHLQELNKDLAEYFGVKEDGGALVIDIEIGSPAEKAGIKAGDVIVKFEDEKIHNPADLRKALAEFEKGDKVDIAVIRHKKERMIKAELDEGHRFHDFRFFHGKGSKYKFRMPQFHLDIPEIEFGFI